MQLLESDSFLPVMVGLTLAAAIALLVLGLLRSQYREFSFAAAALVGVASGAFLSELLTAYDRQENERRAALARVDNYAITEILIRYRETQNWLDYLDKDGKRELDFALEMTPLAIYDDLIRDVNLGRCLKTNLAPYLSVIRGAEALKIREIAHQRDAANLHRLLTFYSSLLETTWRVLCQARENLAEEAGSCGSIADALHELDHKWTSLDTVAKAAGEATANLQQARK